MHFLALTDECLDLLLESVHTHIDILSATCEPDLKPTIKTLVEMYNGLADTGARPHIDVLRKVDF